MILRTTVRTAAALPAALLALVACTPAPVAAPPRPPVPEPAPVLVAASREGAIVLDPRSESFLGLTRTGQRAWQDRRAFHSGAQALCLARCPDAVFSGTWKPTGPDPAPWTRTGASVRPFGKSSSPIRRILTARTASDSVIAEGPAGGAGWLRLIRPAGKPVRVPVPLTADVLWVEDAGRTTALAVATDRVLWFGRDRDGWRLLRGGLPAARTWGACTAGDGELSVLLGDTPRLVLGRERTVPLRTDLEVPGECAAGRESAVIVSRWKDESGRPFTAIRGVDTSGAQTWARDLPAEAQVRADPSGRRFAVVHDGTAELVDQRGRTTATYRNTLSAVYAETGELVLLRQDYGVRWLTP
ncbi:hypothetical protein GCM10010156_19340 [Planobispora rosea]|uniref:Lipoprotein n=1 Tax=Planobispora rosea TaxID=35762 RepID=A0A8J3S1B5_PLARO|nr:hypothetical protein [Planobispora rosea]GGS60748.1 hypothetical protein GCM10010156_19340 [Planobispora rosea]GIH83967.1 hypothetical protein Pro02_23750 [Planobispora rosea]